MRNIVAGLFISLDGVVEAPDKWHFPYFNDEMGAAVQAQADESDAMLFGRQTYQEFAEYWPKQPSDVPFSDIINNTPKYVVSNTLKNVEWRGTTLISGNVGEQLNELKQQPGKNISIIGSGTLVRSLLRDGLLDELRLLIHPIVVGTGKRLFEQDAAAGASIEDTSTRVPLQLGGSQTFSTGVLHCIYRRTDG